MSTKKTVELFYDVVSPYSWLAFEVLCRYRPIWKSMDLHLKPFFLGGVMQGSGNRPPMMVPNKGVYMMADLHRQREHCQVPLSSPSNFVEVMIEKGSLKAQRFITAVDMMDKSKTENISRELWMKIWHYDEDITKPESFKNAGQKAGLTDEEIEDALVKMSSPPVKQRLTDYTQRALDLKAFGAPYIIAHVNGKEECIFGSDRFPILAMILGEEWKGPVPQSSKL